MPDMREGGVGSGSREASDPLNDYVAFFCPNCGAHVNEADLETDHEIPEGWRRGSSYTCGWCGIRTDDWNHVIRCRTANASLEATIRNGRVSDLIELRDELAG